MRNKINERYIYIDRITQIISYIIKNCSTCLKKSYKNKDPCGQIITHYPKERYLVDITELPDELNNDNKSLYLLNLINHYSKFWMSYIIKNKNAKTVKEKIKLAFECNGYLEELGSDNGGSSKIIYYKII